MDFSQISSQRGDHKEPASTIISRIGHNVLDMDRVKAGFMKYHDLIDDMVQKAQAHEVKDDSTVKAAVTIAGEAKELSKKIEAQRKEIIEEPGKFVKTVNAFCKEFTNKLGKIESSLKFKIGQYQHKVELERRKQEETIRKANEELQKKLDAEAKKSGVEAPKVTPMPLPKQEGTVARSSETGAAAHIRKQWKAEIVDPEKVPREFCSPDMKKISEAIKMGIREIEGVRIFEDISTVLRT